MLCYLYPAPTISFLCGHSNLPSALPADSSRKASLSTIVRLNTALSVDWIATQSSRVTELSVRQSPELQPCAYAPGPSHVCTQLALSWGFAAYWAVNSGFLAYTSQPRGRDIFQGWGQRNQGDRCIRSQPFDDKAANYKDPTSPRSILEPQSIMDLSRALPTPTSSPCSPPDWEQFRELITELYAIHELQDVMRIMKESHGFKAT